MNKIIRLQKIELGSQVLIRITYKDWLFGNIINRDAYNDGTSHFNWRFCDNNDHVRQYEFLNMFINSGCKGYIVNGEINEKDFFRSGGELTVVS